MPTFLRALKNKLRRTRPNLIPEAPQINLEDVFLPTVSFHGTNGLFHDSTSMSSPNLTSLTPPFNISTLSSGNLESPTKLQRALEAGRVSSPSLCVADSARLPYADSPISTGQTITAQETPTSETTETWSAAVGRATVGGKSGRVIEKLMGENDRLKRDVNLATVKLQEEERRSESARTGLDSLRTTNENLVAICESNGAALSRKDRKIEELKADLEAERSRREKAEQEAKIINAEREQIVGNYQRELQQEKEIARQATSQYQILSSSWRSLDDSYRRQVAKLRTDIVAIHDQHRDDQQRFARLEVVSNQLNHEFEKVRKVKDRIMADFEAYKETQENGLRGMKERVAHNDKSNDQIMQEMLQTLGEMKYVINVKKNSREVD